ncbi:MAG: DUF4153 domain-containing protein [Lachnospiraceae bacterium]|nr:DUF4153 domain-containing protein [Lachnospiraceae bacterium]
MERFRNFCKKAFSYPALLHKTHPLTAAAVIVTTVLFAVYTFIWSMLDYSDTHFYMDVLLSVCLASVYYTVFALCLESIKPRLSANALIIIRIALALPAIIMGFVTLNVSGRSHRALFNFIDSIQNRLGMISIIMYIMGILVICCLLALYFSYSHDIHQTFNRHILNCNSKIFFSSIIYGVIQLGVLFLTLIVMVLLYDDAFDYIPTILVIINGLFYVPAIIYSLTHENEEANMFFQVLTRYIMLVITMLGFVIIYIYMIKLIVTASVPSNSVYAILTSLFIVSMFVSYMCTPFDETGFLQKFAHSCPLVFAPFILMQCYTIFVRIGQYGLTPKRYFGVAFIIFEITYIVYYTVYKKHVKEVAGRNILLIMCVFVVITVFAPGLSAKGLSTMLAKHTLSSYLEKAGDNAAVSGKEYMHASAAYDFLADKGFGDGKIEKYFQGIDKDTLKSLRTGAKEAADSVRDDSDGYLGSDEKSGWYNDDLMELTAGAGVDISGYNKMMHVVIRDTKESRYGDKTPVDSTKLSAYIVGRDYEGPISIDGKSEFDLSGFVSAFNELSEEKNAQIISDDEFRGQCQGLCIIDITENARMYVTNADTSWNEKTGEDLYINLEGYLFMK